MMNSLAGGSLVPKTLGDFDDLQNVLKSVRFLELPEERTPRKGHGLSLAEVCSVKACQLQSVTVS